MYEKRINQEEKVSMKIREVNEKKQRYFPFSLAIFTGNPKVGVGKGMEAQCICSCEKMDTGSCKNNL